MAKTRILIADDHAILRAGLRMLINAQPDMEVCDEAADGREAAQKAGTSGADVVLIDLTMPAGGGIMAIQSIRQRHARLPLLVLTMHQDPAYVRAALAAGATGYVAKGAADTELLAAIRAVRQGQTFIDPALAGSVVRDVLLPQSAGSAGRPAPALSAREQQVLQMLAEGHTSQRIADRLSLSVKTAETYRSRLARKLGLRSRADFVRYGLESGILAPGRSPDADPM